MSDKADFSMKLSALVAFEMDGADAEASGIVIERLLHATAFSIAIAAKGDAKTAEILLRGAETYLYETAAGLQSFSQVMGAGGRQSPDD